MSDQSAQVLNHSAIATLQLSDEELSQVGGGHMGPSSQSDDDVG